MEVVFSLLLLAVCAAEPANAGEYKPTVQEFYRSLSEGDVDGAMRLWVRSAPLYKMKRQFYQSFFADKKGTLTIRTISRVESANGQASLRIAVDHTVNGKATMLIRSMELVRDQGAWRISDERGAVYDLVFAFFRAKEDRERVAAIEADKELAKAELADALLKMGHDARNKQRRSDVAIKFYQFARLTATHLKDDRKLGVALHWSGVTYDRIGQHAKALDSFRLNLALRRKIGDKKGAADALGNLAQTSLNLSNYRQALEYGEECVLAFMELGKNQDAANAHKLLGMIQGEHGDYAKAAEQFKKSIELHEAIGRKADVSGALAELGMIYQYQGKLAESTRVLERAVALAEEAGDRDTLADALTRLGLTDQARGDSATAGRRHQRSLDIYRELESTANAAKSMHNLAIAYEGLGRRDEAISLLKESLEVKIRVRDRRGAARTLIVLGSIYESQAKYDWAEQSLNRSLTLCRELGDRATEAYALGNLGDVHESQGSLNEALEVFRQSLTILQMLGQPVGVARRLGSIGGIHLKRGEYPEATANYKECLELFRKAGARADEARSLHNLAIVRWAQGDNPGALEALGQSLEIDSAAGNKGGMAGTLAAIGNVYLSRGDNIQAQSHYLRSQALFEKLGEQARVAAVLMHRGVIYQKQGDTSQARRFFEQSRELYEKVGSRSGVASALTNMGNIELARKHSDEAIRIFERILPIYEDLGDQRNIGAVFLNIASAHAQKDHLGEATKWAEQSLKVYEAIGDKPGMVTALLNLAVQAETSGQPEPFVILLASRTATIAEELGDLSAYASAETIRGQSLLTLGRKAEAGASLERAIRATETLASQIAGDSRQQQRFFDTGGRFIPYHLMVELLVSEGEFEEAFRYAQRSKARTLSAILTHGRDRIVDELSEREQFLERRLKQRMNSLGAQLLYEQTRTAPEESRVDALRKHLAQARLGFEAYQGELRAKYPRLAARRGEGRPVTPAELRKQLVDDQTALLEFLVSESQTWLFVMTKDKPLDVFSIDVTADELRKEGKRWREQIVGFHPRERDTAVRIHERLLSPAAEILKGKTRLVIAPDGPLWEIPFAALSPAPGQRLIEQAAVSLSPSLSVLIQMDQKRDKSGGVPPRLLAIGNPSWAAADGRGVSGSHSPLVEAEKEVRQIAAIYGAEHSTLLIGPDAKEGTIKSEAERGDVLHFATHGVLDGNSPLYSFLLLARNKGPNWESTGEDDDGMLAAHEILNMNLRADLAVLSACDTARGDIRRGEGVIGISWAFLAAGCPSTIAGLWKVEDIATKTLMIEFHRNLREKGMSKADALRHAQRSMLRRFDLKTGKLRSLGSKSIRLSFKDAATPPFLWAGFVLIGAR